jgi:DNA polymerase IV (DinB-like DNA polymerase)
VKAFFAPLDIDKLLWVGKKTARKLRKLGINTIGDMAHYDPSVLNEKFGVMGTQLYLFSKGIDNSEVGLQGIVKSIGRNVTFEKDTSDWSYVLQTLDKLCTEIHKEVKENNFLFKTVTVTVRYENFETHTHGKTLSFLTDRLSDLEKVAHELMQPYLRPERKIRLVGARVSSLVSAEKQQKLG